MKVLKRNYDLSGIEARRLFKSRLVARLTPFWPGGAGPGWNDLFVIMMRHYFGYPIAYLTEHYPGIWERVLRTQRGSAALNRGRRAPR